MEVQGVDLSGLLNEPGGHRIQRIPPTERRGRTHTSTVTVAVTDPASVCMVIQDQDLRIEWYSGTGSGGQNRNKVKCSCRITHVPTGIMAKSETRSRISSQTQARQALDQRVREYYQGLHQHQQDQVRRAQVGSGQRGDKIRTYRFQDDRVQDHQTGRTARCSAVMQGHIDSLWN